MKLSDFVSKKLKNSGKNPKISAKLAIFPRVTPPNQPILSAKICFIAGLSG
jgi:hypothetical protein